MLRNTTYLRTGLMAMLFGCGVSCLSEAKSRALDNLGRVHARIGNFQKAIDV